MVIGQVVICSGCCCGAVSRGKPEVPVDWLKQEWRSRGLLKNVQLTIGCCLGPCDLPNVVRISGSATEVWLGKINRLEQYASLVEWASQCKAAGSYCLYPRRSIICVWTLFGPPPQVALAYSIDSRWRNVPEFLSGREEIIGIPARKWTHELEYRLIIEIWAFHENRIAVRFA